MEIKITVKVGGNAPIEVAVDVPVENESETDVKVQTPKGSVGPFTMFFDEGCSEWYKDVKLNKAFLIAMQKAANAKLKRQGYLFLNDVYDMLGAPRTSDGQVQGWIYEQGELGYHGHINFGIFSDCNRDFIDGNDNVALLNFNVDGNILKYL